MSKTINKPKSGLLLALSVLIAILVITIVGILIFKAFMQTGVQGSVIVVEGDCMPPTTGQCASESQNTRKMDVTLYQSVSKSEDGSLTPSGRVAENRNVTNSYSMNALPGKYFLFYRYNDSGDLKEYCAPVLQVSSNQQEPCEVTIAKTGMTNVNITFNFVTY